MPAPLPPGAEADTLADRWVMRAFDSHRRHDERAAERKAEAAAEAAAQSAKNAADRAEV